MKKLIVVMIMMAFLTSCSENVMSSGELTEITKSNEVEESHMLANVSYDAEYYILSDTLSSYKFTGTLVDGTVDVNITLDITLDYIDSEWTLIDNSDLVYSDSFDGSESYKSSEVYRLYNITQLGDVFIFMTSNNDSIGKLFVTNYSAYKN